MTTKISYNVNRYLADIVKQLEVLPVTLDGVLSNVKGASPVMLLDASHKSLSLISDEPFYIGTNFKQISSNLNSRFVLVSAPGATGKSAFGRYVAYKNKAIYWNLAELSIGDGTFQGTLYKALGATKISNYARQLQNGEATLVIDAFDEAEIISGRKNVETFLIEANEFLEESSIPSIILLSRTETAQNIATLFRERKIPYIHYEIDFFPETNAKDFVLRIATKKRKMSPAIERCVNEYFLQVQSLISDRDVRSNFLGYAPVLEAIATHISEITNTSKLLSELKDNPDEVFLINNVMENLLAREHDKLVSAFKERLKAEQEKIEDWDLVYTKDEQLIRILNYILFEEVDIDEYSCASVPIFLKDDYAEMLKIFLPQHPFAQNVFDNTEGQQSKSKIDFAGPAFRDYCLAYTILRPECEASAELYYQQEAATSRFPSPLFWNHYVDMGDRHISSKHFPYVYEAFRSKTNIGYQASLDVSQDEIGISAIFRINKGVETVDSATLEVDPKEEYVFDSLSNTSVCVDGVVKIGQKENVSIIDSSVFCKRIILSAKTITISAFSPNTTTLQSNEPVQVVGTTPANFIVNADGMIQIDFPNVSDFPRLIQFRHSFSVDDPTDIYTFIYYLRKIFSSFRTHKKDMPARDAEKIDFVVVAGSPLKRKIFDFLLSTSIMFREAHLYKVNLIEMSKYNISWGALTSTNIKQLKPVFDEFCKWNK